MELGSVPAKGPAFAGAIRPIRRARAALLALVVAGGLLAEGSDAAPSQESARLTVRPRQMAKGTKNPEPGEYPLTSVTDVLISVPPQGAGAKRCPLVVMLPGGGIPARQMMDWLRPTADKHGLILMTTTKYETSTIDAALKETLEKYAIEPDKIAIIGRCASGDAGMRFGIENLDVFTRIISISGGVPIHGVDRQNRTAEFLIDAGFQESQGKFGAAKGLRAGGHPTKHVLALRGHEHQIEDYDYVGHWLLETWTKKPAERTPPSVVANPVPELTPPVIAKMTAFWTSFAKEPDDVRKGARRELLRETLVPVGKELPSVWMTDMVALAEKCPSVAEALKKAGLTAKQHDAYRVALIGAMVAEAGADAGTNPVQARNVAFLKANAEALRALRAAGIEKPDQIKQVEATATIAHPRIAEAMGAMGIWRTP